MLKFARYDLSVVMVSARPKWLAMCLAQFDRQVVGDLAVERVVVAEGDDPAFGVVCDKFGVKDYISKEKEGLAGAYGKDLGLRYAKGEYVCFWDDDNIYYDHALATLYGAVNGADIGVARAGIMAFGFRQVPTIDEIRFGDVDTMCVCVRRSLALKERWSDHRAPGTDFAWFRKLQTHDPVIRYVNINIGEHLND